MYQLRQATLADRDFLYDLHVTTLKEVITATWGWDEEWQKKYFYRNFNPTKQQIVMVDGRPIGVITIEKHDTELNLDLIEILPEYQDQGIGTLLIRDFIDDAHHQNLPATLHVLKANEPAKRLYERLGFKIDTEEKIRFKMICSPQAENPAGV